MVTPFILFTWQLFAMQLLVRVRLGNIMCIATAALRCTECYLNAHTNCQHSGAPSTMATMTSKALDTSTSGMPNTNNKKRSAISHCWSADASGNVCKYMRNFNNRQTLHVQRDALVLRSHSYKESHGVPTGLVAPGQRCGHCAVVPLLEIAEFFCVTSNWLGGGVDSRSICECRNTCVRVFLWMWT